ncbi:MAG TPA: DUF2865 domain-containing protein [Bradyrhizobium sp.]|nr:DUF2865 domain-containing protein [Bradyrhizobium sp.]
MAAAAVALATFVAAPGTARAENLFDFLFGGLKELQKTRQANFFADPSGSNAQPASSARQAASGGSGPAFCVRSCDGRYFPLARGNASPVQMCQAFCPASPTKVFYGSSIDSASTASGERYADSENAYAYRKALRADCTCNGRDPAGLAPVDLTMDSSLRPGDVIATTDGLVAYSAARGGGNNQTGEFTPIASYPGLRPEVRARLSEMSGAPVRAETIADETAPPGTPVARSTAADGKRSEAD